MLQSASISEAQPALSPARIAVARPRLPRAHAILPYLQQMDEARWYSNFGPLLTAFEQRLADRFPAGAEIVSMVNCTQGLTLALRAMGAPRGSLCALPAWTFVATAHAVTEAGLVPWFVDVDPETWMLDPSSMKALLDRAPAPVGAVIPVSAFGRMPDLAGWKAFHAETGLPVLIDAAAAFDTVDDCELPLVVSLHATKVLGVGEGGFLATRDPVLAERVRQLTTYGFQGSREANFPATNAKLSEYAAAVGLAALDGWPSDRLRFAMAAQNLRLSLAATPEVLFQPGWGTHWVTSVCAVTLPAGYADAVAGDLAQEGIDTRRWWGRGCHESPAFAVCPRTRLSVTEQLAQSTLGLPFSIDLSEVEARRIADVLSRSLAARA